jgi:AcrR family transcriptional regulator
MTTRVSDVLAQRRPHRADAARNFDAILEAARALFHEQGPDVMLADVAKRAGVGIATLYRHFPTKEDLVEAVYVAEVDALCQHGEHLAQTLPPWQALTAWIERFVTYMAITRALLFALDRESGSFLACKEALYESGGTLLARAQEAGDARADVDIDDVMRFIIGVTGAPYRSDEQRDRILRRRPAPGDGPGLAGPAGGPGGSRDDPFGMKDLYVRTDHGVSPLSGPLDWPCALATWRMHQRSLQ